MKITQFYLHFSVLKLVWGYQAAYRLLHLNVISFEGLVQRKNANKLMTLWMRPQRVGVFSSRWLQDLFRPQRPHVIGHDANMPSLDRLEAAVGINQAAHDLYSSFNSFFSFNVTFGFPPFGSTSSFLVGLGPASSPAGMMSLFLMISFNISVIC